MANRRILTNLAIAAALLALGIVATQVYQAWTARHAYAGLRGTPMLPERDAPVVVLIDQDGRPAPLVDAASAATFVFFGFTHCKDTCPLALATLAKAYRTLPKPGGVRIEMVTVDPARDDPATLRRFVAQFDPDFVGLTGRQSALEPVWSAFDVLVDDRSHDVVHGDAIYLLDRHRKVVTIYLPGASADDLAHDARIVAGL